MEESKDSSNSMGAASHSNPSMPTSLSSNLSHGMESQVSRLLFLTFKRVLFKYISLYDTTNAKDVVSYKALLNVLKDFSMKEF